jgi:hypothetical protein
MDLTAATVVLLSVLSQAPSGYVEVTGKKAPMDIPEYVLWNDTFLALSKLKPEERALLDAQVALDANGKELVFKAAAMELERRRKCDERQRAKLESIRAAGTAENSALMQSLRPLILECRQHTLDAADELLLQLGPHAGQRFLNWVNSRRERITVYVHKDDYPGFFRRPR